jgi:hydroxyacylglutathione hydrolase
MYFAQYYLDCLSLASYMVADEQTGQAVVVDPRRDVSEFIEDADSRGLTIVGVINTHFHADFLAGHLELAKATGAWIGYGKRADPEYPIRRLTDGERISLGRVTLQIMETPGHTPESISVVVLEDPDDTVPYGVLTGDALFIGDVGRPDLLASIGVTADELGRELYDSVQNRLMGLPDATRVFPAHGAGSACGKNLSAERQSSIGEQRATNYACQPMTEQDFVALVTAGQPSAPAYFVYDAILNRKDRDVFDESRPAAALTVREVRDLRAAGAVVVDARDPQVFAAGHLTGAVNVPADGRFAETAGSVLAADRDLIVVAPPGQESRTVIRLARIGFDRVDGYLAHQEVALEELADEVGPSSRLTAVQLAEVLDGAAPPLLLDVRNAGEREANGVLDGSWHIPLAELAGRVAEVPQDRPVVVYCAGGYRSSVAASLLRAAGHPDVSDLIGGFAAWQAGFTVAAS